MIDFDRFEEHLTKKDKRDLNCRPLSALLQNNIHYDTSLNVWERGKIVKREESRGYTVRM